MGRRPAAACGGSRGRPCPRWLAAQCDLPNPRCMDGLPSLTCAQESVSVLVARTQIAHILGGNTMAPYHSPCVPCAAVNAAGVEGTYVRSNNIIVLHDCLKIDKNRNRPMRHLENDLRLPDGSRAQFKHKKISRRTVGTRGACSSSRCHLGATCAQSLVRSHCHHGDTGSRQKRGGWQGTISGQCHAKLGESRQPPLQCFATY